MTGSTPKLSIDINNKELILSHKKALQARKEALSKCISNETVVSSYIDESQPEKPQYQMVSFSDHTGRVRIFAIDKTQKLGQGGQGEVYLAQELFEDKKANRCISNLSAVKISQSEHNLDDYDNEFEILMQLNRGKGKCVHNLHGQSTHYLFSQYYPGTNLLDICYYKVNGQYVKKPLNPLLVIKLIKGILSEIQSLHQRHGILHRDLKTNNFIVKIDNDTVTVTVIDFGTSCLMQKANKTFYGTIGYQAPETTLPANQHTIYNLQNEYFSLGVILAELLTKENYQRYIEKKMNDYRENDTLGSFQKKDIKIGMPDIFHENSEKRDPMFLILKEMILFLTEKNANKRPLYTDIDKMIKRLTSLEQEYTSLLPDETKLSHPSSPRYDLATTVTGFSKEDITRQLEALTSELKMLEVEQGNEKNPFHIYLTLNFSAASPLEPSSAPLRMISPKASSSNAIEADPSTKPSKKQTLIGRPRSNSDVPKLNLKDVSPEITDSYAKSSGARHRKFKITKVSPKEKSTQNHNDLEITDLSTPQFTFYEFLSEPPSAEKTSKRKKK